MYDIPDWLYVYLMKFKKAEIIEIMGNALDAMQSYNNRSLVYCIVSAIDGATCTETETGSYEYTLPTKGK